MRFLLDTQIVLWAIYRPARLPQRIAMLVTDEANECFISDVSIWEASLKLSKGKLEYEQDLKRLYERIASLQVGPLPITRRHIEHAVQLPPFHADPFDRILIAQAAVEDMVLVSVDEDILKYDLQILWG